MKITGRWVVYERKRGDKKFTEILQGHNIITNEGLSLLADGIINRNLQAMLEGHFFWSNGTNEPSENDTVSIFLNDGAGGHKQISSITYYDSLKSIKIEMYLSTVEGNSPGQITRILLANGGDSSAKSYASWKFAIPITKNDDKELYFVHYLDFIR